MRTLVLALAAAVAAACDREIPPDAYGNVEAVEIVVGAEAGGRLVSLEVTEGQSLAAEAIVGSVDSGLLALERDRIEAERAAGASRVNEIARQIDALAAQRGAAESRRTALEAEREIAARAFERVQRLYAQRAATAPELDRAERDYRTVVEQLRAQDQELDGRSRQIEAARAQQQTARQQVAAADSQIAYTSDRIRRAGIRNPVAGTVLAVYARTGELVQPGQPLYRIANLETVEVRAYLSETDLARVRIGQTVQVTVDAGPDARHTFPGTVAWISAQAEFTPTPIQTREERADLVYAVKVTVANPEGILKIGMPADVQLPPAGQAAAP